MSIKLTDAQLTMLSAATHREDRCLVAPKQLKGIPAQKAAAKLIEAGLAKEILAKAAMPLWRRDEEAGRSYSLKLTAAGMKLAFAESSVAQPTEGKEATPVVSELAAAPIPAVTTANEVATAPAAAASASLSKTAPRDGTKIAQVIGLLQRDDGATLDEVVAATGWLPHTTRAAFTGLRRRGYAVERRLNSTGAKGYVIVETPQAPSA